MDELLPHDGTIPIRGTPQSSELRELVDKTHEKVLPWYRFTFYDAVETGWDKQPTQIYKQQFFHREEDGVDQIVAYFVTALKLEAENPSDVRRAINYWKRFTDKKQFTNKNGYWGTTTKQAPVKLCSSVGTDLSGPLVGVDLGDVAVKLHPEHHEDFVQGVEKGYASGRPYVNLPLGPVSLAVPRGLVEILHTHDWNSKEHRATVREYAKRTKRATHS